MALVYRRVLRSHPGDLGGDLLDVCGTRLYPAVIRCYQAVIAFIHLGLFCPFLAWDNRGEGESAQHQGDK
jgi:hypothetical protein